MFEMDWLIVEGFFVGFVGMFGRGCWLVVGRFGTERRRRPK